MRDFTGIVLAAGSSTRMGSPKQLLPLGTHTLIERAVLIMVAAGFEEILVVVGANGEEVRSKLRDKNVNIVQNDRWKDGIGSSIKAAMTALLEDEVEQTCRGVLLALADQPDVQPEHLLALAYSVLSGSKVAASECEQTLGAPCAFSREMFPRLLNLKDHQGAKHLIQDDEQLLARIPLTDSADLDTQEEYKAWIESDLKVR